MVESAERVPIAQKYMLTLNEAASYFGIGVKKLCQLTDEDNCEFVIWNGSKRMIKRAACEKFFESQHSI